MILFSLARVKPVTLNGQDSELISIYQLIDQFTFHCHFVVENSAIGIDRGDPAIGCERGRDSDRHGTSFGSNRLWRDGNCVFSQPQGN